MTVEKKSLQTTVSLLMLIWYVNTSLLLFHRSIFYLSHEALNIHEKCCTCSPISLSFYCVKIMWPVLVWILC